ncbi:hypothetical protein FEQ05_06317 [Burkholderia pseudomultivorans]|uniref:Uncharacterized protein n=1 Tax=Burkholderia pseudomultivorans TaxID=1207504 RepID=A0ABU2E9Z0_9BURK|nr:hypothetical protein [Burkholderia pseudomultivorans]MDR8822573.1 hypothetical protein [Burkholderia pseudomultivorans]
MRRHEREARVEPVVGEQRLDALLRHRVDRQHEVRMVRLERIDERAAQVGREGRHHREPQRTAAEIGSVVQRALPRVEFVQRRTRMPRIDLAELGQAHRTARAVEQRHAERFLELTHLLRQRRLRHVQRVGRAREVAVLGDGQEIADMAKKHRDPGIGFSNEHHNEPVLDAMVRFPHHTPTRSRALPPRRAACPGPSAAARRATVRRPPDPGTPRDSPGAPHRFIRRACLPAPIPPTPRSRRPDAAGRRR